MYILHRNRFYPNCSYSVAKVYYKNSQHRIKQSPKVEIRTNNLKRKHKTEYNVMLSDRLENNVESEVTSVTHIHIRTHIHTRTRTHTHTFALIHTHTHTHTHTHIVLLIDIKKVHLL